jgi:hypothetical protein
MILIIISLVLCVMAVAYGLTRESWFGDLIVAGGILFGLNALIWRIFGAHWHAPTLASISASALLLTALTCGVQWVRTQR